VYLTFTVLSVDLYLSHISCCEIGWRS